METGNESFLLQVSDELENDILKYWLSLKDPRGGFYGEADAFGSIIPGAPRGEILNARIIWSFAAAFGMLGQTEYLDAAVHAARWFRDNLIDAENGGVYWSTLPDGTPLDTKKQLYSQGFAIYAFSELYKVTGDPSDLEVAKSIFSTVESCFRDRNYGGYIEALSRDFSPLEDMSLSAHDINADKTMNSHLHLLEAYANLYRVWKNDSLKDTLESLTSLMVDRITGPDGHLRLYFQNDWTVLPGAVSYGHDIETSWLILESASVLDDQQLIDKVRHCSLALGRAGNEGLLEDGSMMYEMMPDGVRDLSRQWWVQAETVVGNLWLWKYHGDDDGFRRAVKCWDWIMDNLVDRNCGEWFWGTDPDGNPDLSSPKAGFWKCPYHNTRMCLEVLKIIA
ncbi:MAG: AGE family epimerase/isomerase [Bacteroidales bacterium]|nr:AGE family epimerase/isomerase [Bacteroidales bacterium]